MKYSPRTYAQALRAALAAGAEPEAAFARFGQLIAASGDTRHRDAIFAEARRELIAHAGGRDIQVEYAQEGSGEQAWRDTLGENDYATFTHNPRLIAGARITINGEEQCDASLTGRLAKLF